MSSSLRVKKGTILRRKPRPEPAVEPYKAPTTKQKYDYLLSKLKITDIDPFELDAYLGMPNKLYFQFSVDSSFTSVDNAVESAMLAENFKP